MMWSSRYSRNFLRLFFVKILRFYFFASNSLSIKVLKYSGPHFRLKSYWSDIFKFLFLFSFTLLLLRVNATYLQNLWHACYMDWKIKFWAYLNIPMNCKCFRSLLCVYGNSSCKNRILILRRIIRNNCFKGRVYDKQELIPPVA